MKKISIIAAAVIVLASCQTAELNRLKEDNDSLVKARETADRESASRGSEIAALRGRLAEKEKAAEELERKERAGSKELAELRARYESLSNDHAALKDENLRLMSALDEIRFAQSMQLHQNRGSYETRKYDASEKPAERPSAKIDAAEAPKVSAERALPDLEIHSGIEKRTVEGRTEFFDALSNPYMDRGFFLSVEEKPDGFVVLRLNVVYSYAAAPDDRKLRIIGLGLAYDGRTIEIPFAPEDVRTILKDGYRKDYVSLPLTSNLANGLKTAFSSGGEVRVLHVFPDYTRERIVTTAERKSLLNVYYAYKEMGGIDR